MRVCNPVLETDTIKYSVQPGCGWLDPGYYQVTKQQHSGCDLNALTGGDSDYGNRVRCVADGVVVTAGQFPSWGGIVLIHHPALGVWTQYAHLINIAVKAGQPVRMGDPVGQIGKGANNQFLAHLHFEVRRSLLPAEFWASSRFPTKAGAEAYIREHYLDPEKWLEEHQAIRTLAALEGHLKVQAAPIITPAGPQAVTPKGWEPVYDPATGNPIPGRYVSVKRRGTEIRLFEVPAYKLKEKGLM